MSSGLEKIINQIEEEAKASAVQIIKEAREKEALIDKETYEAAAQIEAEAEQKCTLLRDDILRKSNSAAHMQRQRSLLATRQQIISEVIKEAKESINNLEEEKYFAIIKKMLTKQVLDEKGKIRFNQRDLARLPEGFEAEISKIAEEKGGSLTLDKAACKIDGGFILAYGGIEENCSFANLFAGAREQLQDKLHKFLFMQ